VQTKEIGYEKGYQQNDEDAEAGERKEEAAPRDEAERGGIGDREEEEVQAARSGTGGEAGAGQR